MQKTHALVVDANGILRNGIQRLLERTALPGSTVEALEDLPDDVALLAGYDLLLLDDGKFTTTRLIEILQTLQKQHPALKVIILSQRLVITHIRQVVQSGVLGLIYKEDNLEHTLVLGVNSVRRDLVYLSPRISERLAAVSQYLSVGDLLPFDLQVLRLMAEGCTVAQMALRLSASKRSVYRSREKLRDVLDVPTNDKIIDAARRQGLLDDE